MSLQIVTVDMLHINDNYNFILHDTSSGCTAVVDPSDDEPILEALSQHGWSLDYVLATHHHWDHIGGNQSLVEATGCKVVGYAGDAARIPAISVRLEENEHFALGQSEARILLVPGHVQGHIAYYFEAAKALFCGDVLFSLGCGRLFEGTAEQMHASLQKIADLPDDTAIYCAHEYTLANGRFARHIEPDNADLEAFLRRAKARRKRGEPTIPSHLGLEKACNPFLRAHSPSIRHSLGMRDASDAEVFAEIRRRKDVF